ncbi:MAG: carboxypeptidase regulatory-like domain-containing protein [Patescibacteria group bacterium]
MNVTPAYAVDTISAAVYQDLNVDGQVDNIRVTFDENVTDCTYEAGDWNVNAGGTIAVSAVTGLTCTGTDAILDIGVTADAGKTGGVTPPTITYTAAAGTADSLVLAGGAATDKVIVPADGTAPVPTDANIIVTKTENAGDPAEVNPGDVINVVWNAGLDGAPDTVSVKADFADFGAMDPMFMENDGAGGNCDDTDAGDGIWCARFIVGVGSINDGDNDVTLTLATDADSNVGADVTDGTQFTVNNTGGGNPHCTNGIQDADEAGVDCGGNDCVLCGGGGGHCTNAFKDEDEAGVDCGGNDCNVCPTCANYGFDMMCNIDNNCSWNYAFNFCEFSHCTSGVQDGNETGVDCGGSCGPCGGVVGDGEGMAMLRVDFMAGMDKMPVSSFHDFEIELTVGGSGIAADGANIQVVIPTGFTAPQVSSATSAGYVEVTDSDPDAELSAAIDGQNINITVASGALNANSMVWIGYGSTEANPGGAAQVSGTSGNHNFTVKTRSESAGTLTPITSVLSVETMSPVKISEVSPDAGSATAEFVELYNDNDSTADISNWQLQYSAGGSVSWTTIAVVPVSTTIPAFGYYLFSTSAFDTASAVDGDKNFPAGLDLNSGHVRIYDGTNGVDKLGWGTAVSPEGMAANVPVSGQSFERKAFGMSTAVDMGTGGCDENMGNGFDSQNNAVDFIIRGTPGPQNSFSPPEQTDFGAYQGDAGGGPMIMHMPMNFAPSGSPLMVPAQMGDPQTPIDQLGTELHYMTCDGNSADNTVTQYATAFGVHQGNGFFQFTIQQATVDASAGSGLCYYLKVVGSGGSGFMSTSPQIDMSGVGDGKPYATTAAKEADVAKHPFAITIEDSSGWTTYSISGTITDESQNGISGAAVMLEGTSYSTVTAGDGTYTLANVHEGIYNMIIMKNGYYDEWIPDINLNSNKTGKDRTLYAGVGGGMTGDSEKPFVIFTGPPDGMFGAPPGMDDFYVFTGFSKNIDSTTFVASKVILSTDGTNPIAGYSVAYNPTRTAQMPPADMDPYLGVIYPPAGGFAANTTYYVILKSTVRDTSGNALQGNTSNGDYVFSFTTGGDYASQQNWDDFGSGAMMPPFVMGTMPFDGAMNVVPNAKINIEFSDPMDSTSVSATTLKLYKITVSNNVETKTPVSVNVSLDTSNKIATLTPGSSLSTGKYRVVVTGALKSATGIWMGDPGQSQNTSSYEFYWSSFEVGANAVADSTAPTIKGTWPVNGDTGIPVNPGSLHIQFSEGMSPSSINSNSITLKRGSTQIASEVDYDPMSKSATLTPLSILATDTNYTLTITTSVTDSVGNAIASNYVVTFTTNSNGDSQAPSIMFANGDDYGIAITFDEPMNAAKVTDTDKWATSVLNKTNYIIKWGDPGTVQGSGTTLNLANAQLEYDSMGNTVIIENLGLTPAQIVGKDYYINMTPADVSGTGAADLSENAISGGTTFQMPIWNSSDTNGMLGPNTGGGGMGPNMGDMGMMMAGAFPMNAMAGQTTRYFVDIPTFSQIGDGYQVLITFPSGFDVSGAKKDEWSPVNNDMNEWNDGIIAFGSAVETSGGANNDGVTVNASTRTITITLAVTGTPPANDYIHFDIDGITNSSIPRDFDTSGYNVDIKIKDANGTLKETIGTMPFFINEGGNATLSGNILGVQDADVDGTNDEVTVFLGSPMTGPMSSSVMLLGDGTGSYSFTSLPPGQYHIFTDPVITLEGHDYSGMPMPEPIFISGGANTRDITLAKEGAGAGKATITVNITGEFGTDDIDIFAGSPNGFKVKTIEDAGSNPSATLYLPDGDWMVGMGPAMPKGPMAGPPPMPDWMPPQNVNVMIGGNGTVIKENGVVGDGTIPLTVASANMQIIGYVKDGSGNPIADAEAFAYQPGGMGGMGAHTKTGTNGKFTLKVAQAGTYSVGVFKPGLPNTPDRTVIVKTNGAMTGGDADGNDTADVKVDNVLVTAANQLIFKLKKSDYTISGKVTNGTNPVSYAPVWAYQTDGMGHVDTMSDSSGNYILYVANGTWVVQANIPGRGDTESQMVVINGASQTQNLSPDSTVTYYDISGIVTINGATQTYRPIRAVKYDASGNFMGQQYSGQTDGSGNYSISVPPGNYRVDIWTSEYGEVGLSTDEIANSPANVIVTNANRTGRNIIIAADDLKTVTLHFINAQANQQGFVHIEGVAFPNGPSNPPEPTGFHRSKNIADLSVDESVQLAAGDYAFFLDVPGMGGFIPVDSDQPNGRHATKQVIVVSANRQVDFSLPDPNTEVFTVTGNVSDGTNNLEGAWVWMHNHTTGNHRGVQTDASGNYSLNVRAGEFTMGVEMPGYAPPQPADLTVDADINNRDFVLAVPDAFINGRIYEDLNTNGSYDVGEAISNGWVWAEGIGTKQFMGAPTDLDGLFSIPVANGTYKVFGVGDGYQDTQYNGNVTVNGSDVSGINIALTAIANWDPNMKSMPITPASGGTVDDSGSDGSGVKLTIPPNALGSDTSSGTVNTKEVTNVTRTGSADPFGAKGVQITASDNSGQAITNLDNNVEVEMVYYKADVEAVGITDYNKLKYLTLSYWDASLNDWVSLSTTKTAYTKADAQATDWTMQTDYAAFVTALVADTDTYYDYKIVLKSTTDHFTVFGATTPTDAVAPGAPQTLSQTSGTGTAVALDWADNAEADLMEYEVYRSTSAGVTAINANQVNTSQVATSTYTDSTTTAWTVYYYTVTATDDSGNESATATEIQVCSTSTVSNGTVAASCAITCNSGYTQSGNSCVASGGGGGGGGGGSSSTTTIASDSNTSTSLLSSTVSSSVTTATTISRPIEVQATLLTEAGGGGGGGKTAQLTASGGSITLKPNADSTISVVIPASTTVSGTDEWDGRIDPPLVKETTMIGVLGETISDSSSRLMRDNVVGIIEVGSDTSTLIFDNSVEIEVPLTDVADGTQLRVYYSEDGNTWALFNEGAAYTVQDGKVTLSTTHFSYYAFEEINGGATAGEETGTEADVETGFDDIKGHWAESFIKHIFALKIVSGKSSTKFAPNDNITRAELTKIAVNAFGLNVPTVSSSSFIDVDPNAWYSGYVEAAANAGWVQGYSMEEGNAFSPNYPINRAEALKILLKAAGLQYDEEVAEDVFPDVEKTAWFAPYVSYSKKMSIVGGYGDGTFRPGANITRAEVAKVAKLILDLVNAEE